MNRIFIGFSFVSGLLIAEVFLAWCFPLKLSFDDPRVFWDHWQRSTSRDTKKLSEAYNSAYMYHDKLGYISKSAVPDHTDRDSDSKYRLMLLGDSIMQSKAFSEPIVTALRNKNPKVSFDFFNAGVGGWDTRQEAIYLETFFSKYRPKLVILQFCMNDFSSSPVFVRMDDGKFAAFNVGKIGKYLNYRWLSSSQILQRLLIAYLHWKPSGNSLDTDKVRAAMKKISRLSHSKNFKVHLILVPYLRPPKNSDIEKTLLIRKIVYEWFSKDHVSDFLDMNKSTEVLSWRVDKEDYTHPNAQFSRLIATDVAEKVTF